MIVDSAFPYTSFETDVKELLADDLKPNMQLESLLRKHFKNIDQLSLEETR